jgi:hypothetical protein
MGRGDEAAPCLLDRKVHASLRGKLDRGLRTEGAIQVLVELGLWQAAERFDQRGGIGRHRGIIGAA